MWECIVESVVGVLRVYGLFLGFFVCEVGIVFFLEGCGEIWMSLVNFVNNFW